MHCCIVTDGSRSAVLCYAVKTLCGKVKVKVQESLYTPITAGWGSQISKQSAHKGGKVVSPTQENIPGTLLCYRLNRPKGHSRKDYINEKITMTTSGIERTTFRLEARCLNQLCYRVPNPPQWKGQT